MTAWHAVNKHTLIKQAKLEVNFKIVWCHGNIFANSQNFISWNSILLLYFADLVSLWRGCFVAPTGGLMLQRRFKSLNHKF
jgi:hypothetical protein